MASAMAVNILYMRNTFFWNDIDWAGSIAFHLSFSNVQQVMGHE